MSKMKHLLRKLHLGGSGSGGVALTDHHHHRHHGRVGDPPRETTPLREEQQGQQQLHQQIQQLPSESQTTSSAVVPALESLEKSNSMSSSGGNANASGKEADFSMLEEEFQMQLALAISVSDADSHTREDPETSAQIKAAKQISLGCSPSQSLADFLSLRYWSYNVINYDEKVVDGFYDVYGIDSNLVAQGKMPILVDLQSVSVADSVDYEVILVNRAADVELRKLEEKVQLISMGCQGLGVGPAMTFLVQKIADVVVERMGGPVNDAEEMLRKWTTRSYELRKSLNTIVLPLGCLNVGLSRHRALLFKVLADKINLPCMLVKGSYYTGTDDGAVNLIKFGNGSEFIIDLMGAPGALIPSEIPSSQLQDIRSMASLMDMTYSCSEFGTRPGTVLFTPCADGAAKLSSSATEPSFAGIKSEGACRSTSDKTQTELFERDFGNILPSLVKVSEPSSRVGHESSTLQQIQVEDVSGYVVTAAKDPEFAQKLYTVLSENNALQHPKNSPLLNPHNLGKRKVQEKNQLLKKEKVVDAQCCPQLYFSNNEQALIPFPGVQLFSSFCCTADRKSSAEETPEKQEWKSTASNPGDNFSSDAASAGFVLVSGRTDQIIQTDDVGEKLKELAIFNQPSSHTIHNEQIDPLLGGVAEWEIPWEDLQIGERIGIGSYGEVYRADWNGTEVAVKKFMNQDISGDALAQFKCEVEIMLRLRHPNLVLFMGAVTRPPNLSILTEFLPRGSLFKLLHRSNGQIDEKRRMRMALDVAKGMNYLHTSHPVIVHRDLKTPNLLVDKNWVVKVCDFGMSRLKHHTFLSSKSTAGTAEWMAPEVLRNEPCNEKSDVYSFGVILWELATLEVPWTGMNSMQVVGAVGFQGRRLNIPECVNPVIAELINECWTNKPHERPSFRQIIARLKCLQRLCVEKTDAEKDQQ